MKSFLLGLSLCFVLQGVNPYMVQGGEGMIEKGSKVTFEYTLTVEGQVVDTSKGRDPLEYIQGEGQIIPGLEKEMEGLKEGDQKNVTILPEDGYGVPDPNFLKELDKSGFAADSKFEAGVPISVQTPDGRTFQGVILEIKEETVMVDFNHPLAGKTLEFEVKVISVS